MTPLILNQNYERLINATESYSCVKEEALQEIVCQLPGITFTSLKAPSSPLQNPEILLRGKELCVQAESKTAKSEKSALLEQAFGLYKDFIKLNRSQIYQCEMRDACMEALFVGADLIDTLETKDQQE